MSNIKLTGRQKVNLNTTGKSKNDAYLAYTRFVRWQCQRGLSSKIQNK